MKKLILFLVVLGFLKGEVKAQAVEWVRTISGVGSLTYVNDSLIYLVAINNCPGSIYQKCISSLSIYNSNGKKLNSKKATLSTEFYHDSFEPQQKFILSGNKVLYSYSKFILESNLKITTVTFPGIFSTTSGYNVVSKDLDLVSIQTNNVSKEDRFTLFNYLGSNLGTNFLTRDKCFYESGNEGIPFLTRNKTLYWSKVGSTAIGTTNTNNVCNKPSNYIPVNTIVGNLVTYNTQVEAIQQTIYSFDSNQNLKLLPFFENSSSVGFASLLPVNFSEDSKGNLIIRSFNGYLGKIRTSNWNTIWTKRIHNSSSYNGSIILDSMDNIYSFFDSNDQTGSTLLVLDSNGIQISTKKYTGIKITNIQTDKFSSIYLANDSTFNYSIGSKILDCYTLTGNFIAKLYTGTIPSTPKLTQSGLVLKSNYPRGVTWYRNDSLLSSENDTFTLALKDGKYIFKAFCKQDTLTFKGISYPNGTLKTFSISGATYQWYLNEVPIPNAITYIYMPTSVGKYTVRINFDKNQALFSSGRASSTNTYQAVYSINLVQLSVDNADSQTPSGYFSLYPNPATLTLTIKTAGFAQVPQAQILNALGQEVNSLFLSSELSSVDVSSFPKGIYSIKVGSQVQKLVVE